MGWIKKDKSVSGQTVVKSSISFDNVNFISNEVSLKSDPTTVPSQQSVKDYVKAYAEAPRVTGDQPQPTNLYITTLLSQKGIKATTGMLVMYIYRTGGTVQNSFIYKLTDDYAFAVNSVQQRFIAQDEGMSNYFNNFDRQDDNTFASTLWVTHAGGFSGTPFTKTDTSMIIDNADVTHYAAKRIDGSLEIGQGYDVTFTVTGSNGNDCFLTVSTDILETDGITFSANGSYTFNFTATNSSMVLIIIGKGSSSCTITDLICTRDFTSSTTTASITFPLPAKFTWYEIANGAYDSDFEEAVTLTKSDSLENENIQGNLYDTSVAPHTFTLSRTSPGTSTRRIKMFAEYEEQITDFNNNNVTLKGRAEHTFYITVTELL